MPTSPRGECAIPGGARGPRPTWRQRFMQMGGQSRPPLRSGTSRTAAPTEWDVEDIVHYRVRRRGRFPYEAHPTGGLVGRDPCVPPHDARWPRRGTWAPPYMTTAHYAEGRTESSAPTEWDVEGGGSYRAGRRGRRPLQSGTSRTPAPTERDEEDVVPYKEGRGVRRWVRRAGGKR